MQNSIQYFKLLNMLPNELIMNIQEYIPKKLSIFFCKKTYLEEHHLIKGFIPTNKKEDYVRTMVRQDNDFVLIQLLNENYERWISMRNYYYKECLYSNYLYFLMDYALDNEAQKCFNVIKQKLSLNGKVNKRNQRYIPWNL